MVIAVEELKLVYTAIPKAGCSSVKAMLAELDPNVTLPEGDEMRNGYYHKLYPTRRFREARFDRYKDSFRFTVVRDPIRRLISVYTNRVVGLGDLHKSRMLKRRGVLPLDPDPDTFFQNLKRYMRMSSIIRHHALPTELFTGTDLGIYDKVYRTNQMTDLAADLSAHTGRPVEAAKANASTERLEYDDLSAQTQTSLRPFLMAEYRHLKGYVDNPFD